MVQTLGKANLVQASACSIASVSTCREKLGRLRQSAAELQLTYLAQTMLTPCPRSAVKIYKLHFVIPRVAATDKHESAKPQESSNLCHTPLNGPDSVHPPF